jgi:hypothetical protein
MAYHAKINYIFYTTGNQVVRQARYPKVSFKSCLAYKGHFKI